MASSAVVATGDVATAAQYNNLRIDVLDTSSGHSHTGTDSKDLGTLTADLTISQSGASQIEVISTTNDAYLILNSDTDEGQDSEVIFESGGTARGRIEYNHNTTGTSQQFNVYTNDNATLAFATNATTAYLIKDIEINYAGTAQDSAIVWDGHAQDFYIGLDDGTDDLYIGTGSTIGSNGAIIINGAGLTTLSNRTVVGDVDLDYYRFLVRSEWTSGGAWNRAASLAVGADLTGHSADDAFLAHALMGDEAGGSIILGRDVTTVATLYLSEPDINVDGNTLTNSATLYIQDAASEATNDYALWVDAGATRLDGTVQVNETLTVGVDDAGHDVKFFGDSAGAYMLWDTSENDLSVTAGIGGAASLTVNSTINDAYLILNSDTDEGQDSEILFQSGGTSRGRIEYNHHATANSQRMSFFTADNAVETLRLRGGGADFFQDVYIAGTTPKLVIGDAGNEDSVLVLDGATNDWYIGLDYASGYDTFVMGDGYAVGTTPRIRFQKSGVHYFGNSFLGTYTSSGDSSVVVGWVFEPVLTAVAGDTSYQSHVLMGSNGSGSITTQNNSETISLISTVFINEPDITKGSDTVTNATSVYIVGAPTEATNNYSLFVDAGASRFDGAISLGTDHGDDGQQLTSGGDDAACDWTAASSLREHKYIGEEADPNSALQAMLDSKAYHFKYKEKMGTGDSNTEYIGVMADDAPWAMHYKGKIVNPVNSLGYTVLSIQALHDRIEQLEKKL